MKKPNIKTIRKNQRQQSKHWLRDPPRWSPPVAPPGWEQIERRQDGAAYRSSDGLAVLISAGKEDDGRWWLHLSVSQDPYLFGIYNPTLPEWKHLIRVRDLFLGPDKTAIQVLPPAEDHVNLYEVLHLFHCLNDDPLPDFTGGSGSI